MCSSVRGFPTRPTEETRCTRTPTVGAGSPRHPLNSLTYPFPLYSWAALTLQCREAALIMHICWKSWGLKRPRAALIRISNPRSDLGTKQAAKRANPARNWPGNPSESGRFRSKQGREQYASNRSRCAAAFERVAHQSVSGEILGDWWTLVKQSVIIRLDTARNQTDRACQTGFVRVIDVLIERPV